MRSSCSARSTEIVYAFLDPRVSACNERTAPLLEVEDLRVSFAVEDGLVRAVDGVSFAVAPGEVLAIVGESGSGKSVTAMTLMGLTRGPQRAHRGPRQLRREGAARRSERELRQIRGGSMAMVFQDPMSSLNPVYRIGDQIVEQIRAHDRRSARQTRWRAPWS